MLIYVIPAIYPSFEYPQSGIFVQEHCAALRKYTNHDFVVLNATTVNYKNWKQCGIIKEYDDVVDGMFDKNRDNLIEFIAREKGQGGAEAIDLLMVCKYLERIGDHATNIAEWVEFSITGVHLDAN